jgi:hypothetical protein
MKYGLLFVPLTILILCSSCAPSWSARLDFTDITAIQKEEGITNLPAENDYPGDDAVIIVNNTDVEMKFEKDGFYTYETVHVLKRLFRNIEKHSSVDLPVFEGEEMLNVVARTILPDQTVVPLKKEDFLMMSGMGGENIFYSDTKVIRFTFPSVKSGGYIEYKFMKKKARPFIADIWRLQEYVPTMVSRYNLVVPKIVMDLGVTWRYKPYNCTIEKPVFIKENEQSIFKGRHLYYWEKRDIPAFTPEPMMPPENNFISYVKFAPAEWSDWNDVSHWYFHLFYKQQLKLDDGIRRLAKELTAQCKNDDQRIAALFSYVKKLRYVSIALGDGGLRPNTPSEVVRRQYGDCKDKSILLHALLWSVEIEAHPVLLITADRGAFDPHFPNWNFNHMIVKAITRERNPYWLDGTLEFATPGELSWNCENINVLTIDNDGTGRVEMTPRSPHYNNVVSFQTDVNVNGTEDIRYDISVKYEGEHNMMMRTILDQKTEKELKEFCKNMIDGNFLTSAIDTCALIDADSSKKPLRLKFGFTSKRGLKQQSDLTFLQFDPFKGGGLSQLLILDKRKYPVMLRFPSTTRNQFTISLSNDTFKIRTTPEQIMDANDVFSFRSTVSDQVPRTLTISEVFGIKQAEIDTSHYQSAKQFLEGIRNKTSDSIVLVKKP